MKCLVVAYIKSEELLAELEGIMSIYQFSIIENNECFRVFQGTIETHAKHLAEWLNTQLKDAEFDPQDSIFIAYPSKTDRRQASLSNIIIKRKGNLQLRKNFLDLGTPGRDK